MCIRACNKSYNTVKYVKYFISVQGPLVTVHRHELSQLTFSLAVRVVLMFNILVRGTGVVVPGFHKVVLTLAHMGALLVQADLGTAAQHSTLIDICRQTIT